MNVALILSGGTGNRVGADIPKQYIEVKGRMLITYCLETLAFHKDIDVIQIVADEVWQPRIVESMKQLDEKNLIMQHNQSEDSIHVQFFDKLRGFSKPGSNRQLSIFNGLKDIAAYTDEDDVVLIHDAARPMLSVQMITDCLTEIKNCDGVMPVLPMKDTVYQSMDGSIVSALMDRDTMFAGQAPEAFRIGKYRKANEALLPERILTINGSSEPAVLAGMKVKMIPGDEENFKVTTKEDLKRFDDLMSRDEGALRGDKIK